MGATSGGLLLEEVEDSDADQGQRLGQREADPQEAGEAALSLGLAGDRLHELPEDDADADAGANRREAVGECSQVDDVELVRVTGRAWAAGCDIEQVMQVHRELHCCISFWSGRRRSRLFYGRSD